MGTSAGPAPAKGSTPRLSRATVPEGLVTPLGPHWARHRAPGSQKLRPRSHRRLHRCRACSGAGALGRRRRRPAFALSRRPAHRPGPALHGAHPHPSRDRGHDPRGARGCDRGRRLTGRAGGPPGVSDHQDRHPHGRREGPQLRERGACPVLSLSQSPPTSPASPSRRHTTAPPSGACATPPARDSPIRANSPAPGIFAPELADRQAFVDVVTELLTTLRQHGVEAAVDKALSG
jgi:hypothetical protein